MALEHVQPDFESKGPRAHIRRYGGYTAANIVAREFCIDTIPQAKDAGGSKLFLGDAVDNLPNCSQCTCKISVQHSSDFFLANEFLILKFAGNPIYCSLESLLLALLLLCIGHIASHLPMSFRRSQTIIKA